MDLIALLVLFLWLYVTDPYTLSVIAIWVPGNLQRIPLIKLTREMLLATKAHLSYFENSVSPEQLVPTGESPYEVYKNRKLESTATSYSVFLALYNILKIKTAPSKQKIIKALQFHSLVNLLTFLSYAIVLNLWLVFSGYPLTYIGWLAPVFLFVIQTVSAMIIVVTRVFLVKLLWRYGSGLSYSLAALLDG